MHFLTQFADLILHLDVHLALLVQQYGTWIYAILFVIVFSETGLVVLPFLPGDSLLFVAGALAALGNLNVLALVAILTTAAALGNMTNYGVGRFLGPKVFQWPDSRFFNRRALDRTHAFFERHGGKAIVISRFVPLFRTFAPFVAGVGAMNLARFAMFNICGALLWVVSITLSGYWLGNRDWVRNNFSFVVLAIVAVSLIPAAVGWLRERRRRGSR